MVNNIAFIAGIHGVGKTTLCEKLKNDLNIAHYSASTIIKNKLNLVKNIKKIAKNVDSNQPALIEALNNDINANEIILDGHFTLFTKNHEISKISVDVFEMMPIKIIFLLTCEPSEIIQRLSHRDKQKHPLLKIIELQEAEKKQALYVSDKLNIPLIEISTDQPLDYDYILKNIKKSLLI
jgi:adenylate kinase